MIEVELIDRMGTDASVVNAARVSFGKRIKEMSEGDTKLIRYLAKHNHWSPFGHASLQFRIKKQGSSGEFDQQRLCDMAQSRVEDTALDAYQQLIQWGVAPEQARMILPQSMMTEWYWSGTLYAFARICNLRCAEDAQYETRIVANLINDECEKLFPISWIELRNT
jgi:thymidylate synthase (FAD)